MGTPPGDDYRCRVPSDHPAHAEITRRHHQAVEMGIDSYADPLSGFRVFTTRHHLERGACCESVCRHCPFGFEPPGRSNVAP